MAMNVFQHVVLKLTFILCVKLFVFNLAEKCYIKDGYDLINHYKCLNPEYLHK